MRFNFALSLLASPFLVHGQNLRGLEEVDEFNTITLYGSTGTWDETIKGAENACVGSTCAVYGDPHVKTCDGLAYDCQAVGVFNLMDNHVFKIQGHFAPVRDEEELGHLRHVGGSLLNDVAIDFVKGGDAFQIVQLGFGDVSSKIDIPPSHVGCNKTMHWVPAKEKKAVCGTTVGKKKNKKDYTSDPGMHCYFTGKDHGIDSVYKCKQKCAESDYCTKFNYWADERCELYGGELGEPSGGLIDDDGNDTGMVVTEKKDYLNLMGTRSMGASESDAGDDALYDECGVTHPTPELKVEAERLKHGMIGKGKQQECPLLLYLDGELQDISDFAGKQRDWVHGDEDSDFRIYMQNNQVRVFFKMPDTDETALINLEQRGDGPGEKWNCHWHLRVCLPSSEEEAFKENPGTGLMGTPNNDRSDDWMTSTGDMIEIPDWKSMTMREKKELDRHQIEYDYCLNNHCVDGEDSIVAIPGEWTWEDIRCQHIPYNPPDNCDLTQDFIEAACEHVPQALQYSCHLDCCYGGCKDAPDDICEEFDCEPDDSDDNSSSMDRFGDDDFECTLHRTGDTICPGSETSVVKVLHVVGAEALHYTPDSSEIIHSIEFKENTNTVQFRVNNPFVDTATDIYVKHQIHTGLQGFLSSECDSIPGAANCIGSAEAIEIACRNYDAEGISFAVPTVYFSSDRFPTSENKVDQCCIDEDIDDNDGVVQVTFEIPCRCPSSSAQ